MFAHFHNANAANPWFKIGLLVMRDIKNRTVMLSQQPLLTQQ